MNTEYQTYRQKYYRQTKDRWYEYLGAVCVNCGSKENLELDHIDQSKKSYEIGQNWSRSFESIKGELDKIQLLCTTCHKTKHSKRVHN